MVDLISFTSSRGGAAKATARIFRALTIKKFDVKWYTVEKDKNSLYKISSPCLLQEFVHKLFWYISQVIIIFCERKRNVKFSLNLWGSSFIKKKIKNSKTVHLHWINNETLAIRDFKLLSGKSVITLHDEWFYCGAEHYALNPEVVNKANQGYRIQRPFSIISYIIWHYKKVHYKKLHDVIFTVPSVWMQQRALSSYLLRGRDIRVVPNPINTDLFCPSDTKEFQLKWNIDETDFVILFGAVDGTENFIKGYDLIEEALKLLSADNSFSYRNIKIVIFGGKDTGITTFHNFQTINVGFISNEVSLVKLYSLASITIVPSRAESFGQVAAESLACTTPVVCFGYSGLLDIVEHKKSGYLAEPFDPISLADGIRWCINLENDTFIQLGKYGRDRMVAKFSFDSVAKDYLSIYSEIQKRDKK